MLALKLYLWESFKMAGLTAKRFESQCAQKIFLHFIPKR